MDVQDSKGLEHLQSYNVIVVGAGFAGAASARMLAERMSARVAVIEQRPHIGGNAYDMYDKNGVLIHRYGPHIFHTNDSRVYTFLSRFTDWREYEHRVLANVHGTLMPVPFNHESLIIAFGKERGEELYDLLRSKFGGNKKVRLHDLQDVDSDDLQEVADYVYKNIFLHYTLKQWGQTPDEVDPSVIGRVPIMIGDDDRYFQDKRQGMPIDGYTPLFENLLTHDLIDVYLSADARDYIEVREEEILVNGQQYFGDVIYTGPLDELFDLKFGALPYRSLNLCFETFEKDQFQPVGTINYTTEEKDFTRITEFKHLTGQKIEGVTTTLKEFPCSYSPHKNQIPYYAIINSENIEKYTQYRKLVENVPGFWVVGRLAEYRYYDMDAVVAQSLHLVDEILESHGVI